MRIVLLFFLVEIQSKFTFSLNVYDTSVFDYSVEVETQSKPVQRKPDGLSWRRYHTTCQLNDFIMSCYESGL